MAPTQPTAMPPMAKQSTPKTMSSRLMTMKFMQRGAAAAAAAAAASEASSPATPRSEDGSAKRRKFAHTPSVASSPATPLYDQQAIKAALEEEEKKRQAAIEKRAAELGDSHWVLEGVAALPKIGSRPPLSVVQVGFAQIDYPGSSGVDDDPFDLGSTSGQAQIRRFNMKQKKVEKKEDEEGSSSGSESGSDEDSDSEEESNHESSAPSARDEPARGRRNTNTDATAHKRARSSMSRRREEERKKAQLLARERRKKEIKLNQLSSISSAGSQAFQKPSTTLSCHGCGKPGHKVADCPNKKR